MKYIKKDHIISISIFILGLLAFGSWYTNQEKINYKRNGVLTQGLFISYRYYSPARLSMTYSYVADGKTFTKSTTLIEYPQGAEKHFLNRSFPVIYINSKPEESQILYSEAKFKYFDIKFPDSLIWTRNYTF